MSNEVITPELDSVRETVTFFYLDHSGSQSKIFGFDTFEPFEADLYEDLLQRSDIPYERMDKDVDPTQDDW